MKTLITKLVWSAFAVSLMLLPAPLWAQADEMDDFLELDDLSSPESASSLTVDPFTDRAALPETEAEAPGLEMDDFLGLETLPVMGGDQRFSPPDLHQDDWQVKPNKSDPDLPIPIKGQRRALIDWSKGPQELLDIKSWMLERAVKDKTLEWKAELRHLQNNELAGRIISCQGTCQVYRGLSPVKVTHLSRLHAGDELHTAADSVAWVYLIDGTLLRLGPDGSLSLREVIINSQEVFFLIRLNVGHVFWHPRHQTDLKLDEAPETDVTALPLLIKEANQAHFDRKIFQQTNDRQRLSEVISLEENAVADQYRALNQLKNANNKFIKNSRVMLVAPNVSLMSSGTSFDLVHVLGGASYFKGRPSAEADDLSLQLRSYTDATQLPVAPEQWFEVDQWGSKVEALATPSGILQVLELLTKRIKTLELAREIWYERFTRPLLFVEKDHEKHFLAQGHLWWTPERTALRMQFLAEYTRRMETTNLRAVENLLNKYKEQEQKERPVLAASLYQHAVNLYLMGLKSRYTNEAQQVREMNDLQYYIWILRNGKQWTKTHSGQHFAPSTGITRSPWDSF